MNFARITQGALGTTLFLGDLQVRPSVPIKGARKVAGLTSTKFLSERIRLTQRAKRDWKKDAESTAQSMASALLADNAAEILDKIDRLSSESLRP